MIRKIFFLISAPGLVIALIILFAIARPQSTEYPREGFITKPPQEKQSSQQNIQSRPDLSKRDNGPSITIPETSDSEEPGAELSEDEREFETYMRRQPDEEPGLQLDPRDPQMTGDPAYDRKTRIAAALALYTEKDFRAAIEMARGVLEEEPDNLTTRLLMVRAACGLGTENLAREHWLLLPEGNRHLPVKACRRFGINLTEP